MAGRDPVRSVVQAGRRAAYVRRQAGCRSAARGPRTPLTTHASAALEPEELRAGERESLLAFETFAVADTPERGSRVPGCSCRAHEVAVDFLADEVETVRIEHREPRRGA